MRLSNKTEKSNVIFVVSTYNLGKYKTFFFTVLGVSLCGCLKKGKMIDKRRKKFIITKKIVR